MECEGRCGECAVGVGSLRCFGAVDVRLDRLCQEGPYGLESEAGTVRAVPAPNRTRQASSGSRPRGGCPEPIKRLMGRETSMTVRGSNLHSCGKPVAVALFPAGVLVGGQGFE